MAEADVAGKEPKVMELEAGKYNWCACGKSGTQPFCDGLHENSGITPVEFSLTEKKVVAICMCKHTTTPPFCDGTHSKF